MAIDKATKIWGPDLQKKMKMIKDTLIKGGTEKHKEHLEIVENIEKTFLFGGYKDYFTSKVPRKSRYPIVLAHNDA
jgi:hypothetical protein